MKRVQMVQLCTTMLVYVGTPEIHGPGEDAKKLYTYHRRRVGVSCFK